MNKGVDKLKKVGIWTIYFSIYYIDPKDARTTDGKFGIVRKYESKTQENVMQAISNSIYYAVKYCKDIIAEDERITIDRIVWSETARLYEIAKSEFYGISEKEYSMDIKIDNYYPSKEDLEISYKAEEIFEAMDCCISCGRKEGPYSDAKLVGCKGCPELVCQYCNLQELGCKMCYREDDLSFSSSSNFKAEDDDDYVEMMECPHCHEFGNGEIPTGVDIDSGDRWNPPTADITGWETCEYCEGVGEVEDTIENSKIPSWDWDYLEPDEPDYDRHEGKYYSEEGYYFDDISKKHGIISNKLLLGSLAVILSIASIGNMTVKTIVNAKDLSSEDELVKSKEGCGCGCKKKGGCN